MAVERALRMCEEWSFGGQKVTQQECRHSIFLPSSRNYLTPAEHQTSEHFTGGALQYSQLLSLRNSRSGARETRAVLADGNLFAVRDNSNSSFTTVLTTF
jgi:hypothetical protein